MEQLLMGRAHYREHLFRIVIKSSSEFEGCKVTPIDVYQAHHNVVVLVTTQLNFVIYLNAYVIYNISFNLLKKKKNY
jgi:hypothetical protein